VQQIVALLEKHSLLANNYVFFDAFCGTGTVANAVSKYHDIVLNDNLLFATIYAKGRIVQNECVFANLGYNPIEYFNGNEFLLKGFVYHNYSPAGGRMYFSEYNAQRIDYFRQIIEDWHIANIINENEYCYLLCCLLESISKVANVAGVYGAFLKTWDARAKKNIIFIEPEKQKETTNEPRNVIIYNSNIEEIIPDVHCDILYLDPPYTHNSYSVQYHILETIIRNDNPDLKGITGARKYSNIFNRWSKKYEVEVAFEKVVAETLNLKQALTLGLKNSAEGALMINLSKGLDGLYTAVSKLEYDLSVGADKKCSKEKAEFAKSVILADMRSVREHADFLESITDKELWPYPNYTEILNSVTY
jgi:adenine-specific DNA-methyltransferase